MSELLAEDELLLKNTVRDFADRELAPRAADYDESAEFPWDNIRGLADLGLFGLTAFTAEQRTKEVGIRKVLGASAASIVLLLSRDFTRLVVAALIVAAPFAYLAMNRWLDGFAE